MMTGSDGVFVCGGSGFIGSNLIKHLTRPGSSWGPVKALVRSAEGAARVRAAGGEPVFGDLLDEVGSWREAAVRAAVVVNCAQPSITSSPSERSAMDRCLLRSLDPSRLRRVVMVFGSSYYGRTDEGDSLDETVPTRRPTGLGMSYAPGVRALRGIGQDFDWVAAFPGGVYGRGTWFLEHCLRSIQRDEPIVMRDPPAIWPYIHIEDCVRALEFLMAVDGARLDALGREVILADDEPAPMSRFVDYMSEEIGKPTTLRLLSEDALRELLPPFYSGQLSANMVHRNTRLRRLGFELKYPHIREGIRALDLPRL
ncbi:NAD-dependent epimerase/dehydratase family protein [Sorangium sp. So ce1078]|uniref:NAD-dependent epimerase/dehydratase family protein n=1 Tax=Sorangium sp. So ce1078 TaxID=3133329 RepID=UPI003F5DCDD9